MRTRHAVILMVFAAVSLAAQEEPLPAITPRDAEVLLVALPLEPVLPEPRTSLADAARANDFPTFDALYEDAGRPAAYRALHDLWSYAMTDPLGAFYGEEMHARFARAYEGYEEFIDEHRIVDNRGNVFYPTAETRAFLLTQAQRGNITAPEPPRSIVAESRPRFIKAENTTPPPPAPVERRPLRAPEPVVVAKQEKPAAEAAAAPPAPVVAPPVVVAATAPPPPVVAAAMIPAPLAKKPEEPSSVGRGLLLVIIGLVGVGLLATIMRTPREIPSVTPRRDP